MHWGRPSNHDWAIPTADIRSQADQIRTEIRNQRWAIHFSPDTKSEVLSASCWWGGASRPTQEKITLWLPINLIGNHWDMQLQRLQYHWKKNKGIDLWKSSLQRRAWEKALGKYNILIHSLDPINLIGNQNVRLVIYFNWRYDLNISLDLVSLDRLHVLPWSPSSQSR